MRLPDAHSENAASPGPGVRAPRSGASPPMCCLHVGASGRHPDPLGAIARRTVRRSAFGARVHHVGPWRSLGSGAYPATRARCPRSGTLRLQPSADCPGSAPPCFHPHELERAPVRGAPAGQRPGPCRLGVGAARRPEHRDEALRLAKRPGVAVVSHRHRVPRVLLSPAQCSEHVTTI